MKRRIDANIQAWANARADRPLLIRGARRVGKTYSAETIARDFAGDQFVKLDFQTDLETIAPLFDGPTDDLDGIISRIEDYKRISLRKESAILLLDEVQLCERALNSLRFFSGSGWKIIATGSQLGVDTKQRKLPFPSGVEQITMHPMTFEEFLWAMDEPQMATAIREHTESMRTYASHKRAISLFHLYQVLGGMPRVLQEYIDTGRIDDARVQQHEIDQTYTADMTDPDNGINGISARRIWRSIPSQLLRASTKKFKYSEVERGGRRARLLEPLEWLAGAGVITINERTECTEAPLIPYDSNEGSFFKVYMADTGMMFYKLQVNPMLWLEAEEAGGLPVASNFKGALAENAVMQALTSSDLQTYYWTPPAQWGGTGELDFLLQDNMGRIIPIEVKSGTNVRAKTLKTYMEHASSPYAIKLSEDNFAEGVDKNGMLIRHIPLYAAYCLGKGCAQVS